jgi:hypothetical protein
MRHTPWEKRWIPGGSSEAGPRGCARRWGAHRAARAVAPTPLRLRAARSRLLSGSRSAPRAAAPRATAAGAGATAAAPRVTAGPPLGGAGRRRSACLGPPRAHGAVSRGAGGAERTRARSGRGARDAAGGHDGRRIPIRPRRGLCAVCGGARPPGAGAGARRREAFVRWPPFEHKCPCRPPQESPGSGAWTDGWRGGPPQVVAAHADVYVAAAAAARERGGAAVRAGAGARG